MEHELMEKMKQQDRQAFSRFYEDYADYALRVAFAVTKDRELASDAVQETFIRVYRNLHTYDTAKPFKPWFYRILLNECSRLLKRERKVVSIEDIQASLASPPERSSREWLEYGDLYEALEQLDELNRTPILLKYIHDLSEKEIAEALDVNVNTVKSRLFKGRQKLKNALTSILKGGSVNE